MSIERPRQVAQGVEWFAARTPTLPPATHTNSFALGQRELLLVEPATPYDDERRAWLQWARGLRSKGRELLAVMVTHHHIDHVGGASFLAEELGLPLWAHAETARRIDAQVTRELSDGEIIVLDGPQSQSWRCLLTPGHAQGHICLYEAELGAVLVGDMVASEGTILIEPGDGDLQIYLEQLERLEGLAASIALPAHGAPIETPSAHFRHYIDHRLMREAKVVAALTPAPQSLDELLPAVYGDVPKAIWPIASLSLQAHLIKLDREGRARQTDNRWQLTATAQAQAAPVAEDRR